MRTPVDASSPLPAHDSPGADPVLLDLRDLEPPEPLRVAIEALVTLTSGASMITRTRFRPVHLLSVLDDRGFAWETAELPDGSWETTIITTAASESS